MMSFLALNLQVAEASVAMHEMPIATAAKEIASRQAMAFPFLEDVCIGRPGHHAGVCTSRGLARRRRSRPRWPAPLVEPGAVFAHLFALRCRRVALAGR